MTLSCRLVVLVGGVGDCWKACNHKLGGTTQAFIRRQQQVLVELTYGECMLPCVSAVSLSTCTLNCQLTTMCLQQFLNIPQACKYVPGHELLQMDPNEACDKLRTTLKVLGSFKSHYFTYKAISAQECTSSPWRFQNSIIFGRLDTFLERCADMMELQSTCLQVSRPYGLYWQLGSQPTGPRVPAKQQ